MREVRVTWKEFEYLLAPRGTPSWATGLEHRARYLSPEKRDAILAELAAGRTPALVPSKSA